LASTIEQGLLTVRSRIERAARAAGRDPASIQLIAVSKTFPASAVVEALHLGQDAFGENHAQEAVDKIAAVRDLLQRSAISGANPELRNAVATTDGSAAVPSRTPIPQWHFIGPIQSNKTRLLAEHFDWVQSVDRLKVAQRLSDQRARVAPALQICIQVNISGEASKSGVEPAAALSLAQQVCVLPGLRLRGLMAIPEPTTDVQAQRRQFRRLRELLDELIAQGLHLDTLSIGMSDDFEAAIAEGATMVRVGRAIFGERE